MKQTEEAFSWVSCPICSNQSEIKVYEDTVMINFPLYCPKCKKETPINVVKLKMTVCK